MTERELLDALARDVAEALTAIADREENWAGVARSFASGIYDRHARPVEPPTPPAAADDAGARLVEACVELERPHIVWANPSGGPLTFKGDRVLDLARTVVRERDEARRKCEDAMADALHAHTARLAAERDRDEAQQAVTDAMQREGHAKAQYFIAPTAYVHMPCLAAPGRAAPCHACQRGPRRCVTR